MSNDDDSIPEEPEAEAPAIETPAPTPEIRHTAEEWADLGGYTPAMNGNRENPRFWRWAAARLRWPVGAELTEAEFVAAINDAATVEIKN